MGGKQFLCGAKFLLLPVLMSVLGCAHLIVYDDDPPLTVTSKVVTRTLLCPATLCFSEAFIADIKDDLASEPHLSITESHDPALPSLKTPQRIAVWGTMWAWGWTFR